MTTSREEAPGRVEHRRDQGSLLSGGPPLFGGPGDGGCAVSMLVGPVASDCAVAWTGWMLQALEELRAEPASAGTLRPETLDAIESYVRAWARATRRHDEVFRWQCEIHPDELEYVTNGLYNLDGHLSEQVTGGRRPEAPAQGKVFHGMVVEALLHALAEDSPCRAAFSEQLRQTWPSGPRPT